MPNKLTGPYFLPHNNKIDKAFIFLHGYGSNGEDLISLAPQFEEKSTGYFSPNAPAKTNMGIGYEWFSDNNGTFIDKAGMEVSLRLLENYLADIHTKYNIPYNKMMLVGFSQGTMMSLYSAPRLKHAVAGVIGFSGRLMWNEELKGEKYHKPPIILIHGEADDVLPYDNSITAGKELEEAGFKVEVHIIPNLPHGIDENGLNFAKKWLKDKF